MYIGMKRKNPEYIELKDHLAYAKAWMQKELALTHSYMLRGWVDAEKRHRKEAIKYAQLCEELELALSVTPEFVGTMIDCGRYERFDTMTEYEREFEKFGVIRGTRL